MNKEQITNIVTDANVSEETLDALEELGLVLKSIYIKMKKEGYDLVDGKVVKVKENEQPKSNRNGDIEGDCKRQIP